MSDIDTNALKTENAEQPGAVPAATEIENTPQPNDSAESGEGKKGKRKNKKENNKKEKNNKKAENPGAENDANETDDDTENESGKKNPGMAKALLMFVISVGIFLATLGCQYLFSDVLQPQDKTEIINWMFVTGSSDAAVANAETFNQAEKSHLISKPRGDQYVRCIYNIAPSSEPMILKLVTDHSPVKVLVDGKEIYNNGYEEKVIVGNSYNEILLPEAPVGQRLELLLFYPLGFHLQANVVEVGNSNPFAAENIWGNLGLIFSVVLVVIGIALSLFVFAFMFRSRDVVVLLKLGITLLLTGLALFAVEIVTHSAVFESTIWFSAAHTLSALLFCLIVSNIHSLMSEKRKITAIASFAAPLLSVLIWIPNITVMRAGLIACAAAVVVSGILLFLESANWNNVIIGNHAMLQIIGVYVLLAFIVNSLASAFGFWKYSSFLFIISTAVFMLTLFFIYSRKIAKTNLAEYARGKDGSDSQYIFRAVSDIISESNEFSSKEDFIIAFSKKTLDFLEKSELILVKDTVSVNIAVERKGVFSEIYASENASHDIDYASIGEFLKGHDPKYTVGSSFIEMLLDDTEPVLIVFNQVYNSPESNLHSFISSLYSSVLISYQSFSEHAEMSNNLNNMFINLAIMAEERAYGTGTHLFTVSKTTELLAKQMGFGEDADMISKASILHDIGKITISQTILNKRGVLTPNERELMKQHVFNGYNLLEGLNGKLFEIARSIVLEHHENFDGSGYLGKKGEAISIYARIVKVADVFDALVSKREYKNEWSYEDAVAYIYERQGREFDPQVVKAFIACAMDIIDVKENEAKIS